MHGRGRRRWWTAGLSVAAAAAAAAMTVTPVLGGGRPAPTDQSFLNQAEGGGFDHNLAHRASSPQAKAAALEALDRCASPGWRSLNPESCPADGASTHEVKALRAEAADAPAQALAESDDGLWEALKHIDSTAIHGVVMPTGKVLYFSQPKYPTEIEAVDGGTAHVFDPATGTTRSVPPPVVTYDGRDAPFPDGNRAPANLWCAGQTLLPDGRVLVVGGNLEYPTPSGLGDRNGFKGGKWVMTFDPWTETWTRYADMPHGRWYPTLTTLPNGKVLIIGGWDETGGDAGGNPNAEPVMHNDQDVEVFDPALATHEGAQATTVVSQLPPNGPGQPQPFPDHTGIGLYPHVFVLPDTTAAGQDRDGGNDPQVLVAGPLQWDSAIIDTGSWLWTDVLDLPYDPGDVPLSSDRAWGTAYLEPSGPDGSTRVVLLGGSNSAAAAPGAGSSPPPLNTAEVLDLNDWQAGWKLEPDLDLNEGRAHFNTVLLPDGSIFSNGGGFGREDGSMYAGPIYSSELLAPGGAGGWRVVGNEADARTYHSTSLLLPDGKVISSGDDRDIAPSDVIPPDAPAGTPPGHIALASRTYQLYDPPYLFKGARPAVTFAPQRVRYDAAFRVAVQGDPGQITSAYLMRPGAVTHAVDMSQQAIRLGLSTQADGITLTTPRDTTVAPPGYYMLFLRNAAGAVSVATWIQMDPAAPDAPALPANPGTPDPEVPRPAPQPEDPVAPTAKKLKGTLAATRLTTRGSRLTVRVRLKASAAATARITLARPNGKAVTRRAVKLRAGRLTWATLSVTRARLHGAKRLRVTVALSASGRRTAKVARTVTVPRFRSR